MTQRTSRSHLTSICKRLKRARFIADLKTYLGSPDYATAVAGLSAADHVTVAQKIAIAWARLDAKVPIPAPFSMRVRWTPERLALLKRLAQAGRDVDEIAREMALPIGAVRRARWTVDHATQGDASGEPAFDR